MKNSRIALGGFLETKIGGVDCVLINGRWVRAVDREPYGKKHNGMKYVQSNS